MIRDSVTSSALWSRRSVVRTGILATATVPAHRLLALSSHQPRTRRTIGEINARQRELAELTPPAIMQQLVLAAIDAAQAAGALYASAQITRTVSQTVVGGGGFYRDNHGNTQEDFMGNAIDDVEHLALSVRALMPGGWGFVATPYWTVEEAGRLGREAVTQATINGRVLERNIDIGKIPVAKGTWTPPGVVDPFSIGVDEKLDYFNAWNNRVPDHAWRSREKGVVLGGGASGSFSRMEQTVATTEGALFSQVMYRSSGNFGVTFNAYQGVDNFSPGVNPPKYVEVATLPGLELQGGGWEIFKNAGPVESIPALVGRAMQHPTTERIRPVSIGRFTVVFDAATMGKIVETMIGTATQLDRALGFEANSSGTSYLGPAPLELLGNYSYNCAQLNVAANRSQHSGLATVKWDDEGVEPENTTLVKNGVLVDYQTNREQASMLAPYYQKIGRPVRSHGFAASEDALRYPMQMMPNLTLEPGAEAVDFDDMVKSVKNGIAISGASMQTDFQGRNGTVGGSGVFREIVNGRLGSHLHDGGALLDAQTLWKTLTTLGGAASAKTVSVNMSKGEPSQSTWSSLTAVPALFTDIAIVDLRKKA